MADTPKHTPGPWLQRVLLVVDERGNTITHCTRWEGPRPEPQVAEANAAFIVRACNSHYDLLEALKGALGFIEADRDFQLGNAFTEDYALAEMVKAAIAKAEGR